MGVLKGSVVFLADLIRASSFPMTIDFIGLASYGGGTRSSGAIKITADLSVPVEGRHVLVVEDIIDTGKTIDYLKRHLQSRNPRSLKI